MSRERNLRSMEDMVAATVNAVTPLLVISVYETGGRQLTADVTSARVADAKLLRGSVDVAAKALNEHLNKIVAAVNRHQQNCLDCKLIRANLSGGKSLSDAPEGIRKLAKTHNFLLALQEDGTYNEGEPSKEDNGAETVRGGRGGRDGDAGDGDGGAGGGEPAPQVEEEEEGGEEEEGA